MTDSKYQFKWLAPTNNIDLEVYENAINAYIITHNLSDEDKCNLYIHYNQYNEMMKMKISSIVISSFNEDTCKAHFDELSLSELNGIFTKVNGRRNYKKTNDKVCHHEEQTTKTKNLSYRLIRFETFNIQITSFPLCL